MTLRAVRVFLFPPKARARRTHSTAACLDNILRVTERPATSKDSNAIVRGARVARRGCRAGEKGLESGRAGEKGAHRQDIGSVLSIPGPIAKRI